MREVIMEVMRNIGKPRYKKEERIILKMIDILQKFNTIQVKMRNMQKWC